MGHSRRAGRSGRRPLTGRRLPGLLLVPAVAVVAVPLAAGTAGAVPRADGIPMLQIIAGTGSGAPVQEGPAAASDLDTPSGVAVDAWGTVYVADSHHHEVERVDRSGTLSIVAGTGIRGMPTNGPARSSMLGDPAGVATDRAGDLFIADYTLNLVEKVTPDGRLFVLAGTGSAGPAVPGRANASPLDGPFAVATDAAGSVYIADSANHRVEKVSISGQLSFVAGNGSYGPSSPGPSLQSALYNPTGVAVDGLGDVYIADRGNNRVEKVTPDGRLSEIAGTGSPGPAAPGPAVASALNRPAGVAVDTSGTIFVSDMDNHQVQRIVDGQLDTIAGTGVAGPAVAGPAADSPLDAPSGLAVGVDGDLYVADQHDHRLDRITNVTTRPPAPAAVTIDAPPSSAVVGSRVALSGTAQPGSTVELWFHRAGSLGYTMRDTLVTSAPGTWTTTYDADDDYRVYATAGPTRSATVLVQIRPNVDGPTNRIVPRNSTVALSGTATPGGALTLHFHRAWTPADDYSIVRTVRMGVNGAWSRPFVASVDYRYYVSLPNGQRSPAYLTQAR